MMTQRKYWLNVALGAGAAALLLCGPGALAQGTAESANGAAQNVPAATQDQTQLPGVTTSNEESQMGPEAYSGRAASDQQMLKDLHKINLKEIRAGELAQKHGVGADVKTFGDHLVRDHKSADSKVMAYARDHKINLGDEAKFQKDLNNDATIKKLESLRGTNFDKYFSSKEQADHAKAISMVQMSRDQSSNSDFKNLMNQILPDLKAHYNYAARLDRKFMKRSKNP